jgi:hypothetical protein
LQSKASEPLRNRPNDSFSTNILGVNAVNFLSFHLWVTMSWTL